MKSQILKHPEAEETFKALVTSLDSESDRGAVLIAVSHIDNNLALLFRATAPRDFGKNALDDLLEYPGALSSFSARTRVAVLCRLIPVALGESINELRKIRNAVAHSPDTFQLRDHQDSLTRVYDLGPGVPSRINRWAQETILRGAVARLASIEHPDPEEDGLFFDSPSEAVQYLRDNPDLLSPLEAMAPRRELAIGVALICGILIFYREQIADNVPDHQLLGRFNRPNEG